MKKRIAITGGIAEGKSTVLQYCREAGYDVASSDQIAREVFESSPMQEKISLALGLPLPLDRAEVRRILYEQPELRRRLNALLHPEVLEHIRLSEANIFEVPLLIETCLQGFFDRVWVVTCGSDEQFRRLSARLGNEMEARRLIATQLTSRAKCAFADLIVRTNGEESSVRRIVIEAVGEELG